MHTNKYEAFNIQYKNNLETYLTSYFLISPGDITITIGVVDITTNTIATIVNSIATGDEESEALKRKSSVDNSSCSSSTI
ncbi:unnamed protein product [Heterobilharzia americana]|nr:unnamed protein product [Heterobilharzia americana]